MNSVKSFDGLRTSIARHVFTTRRLSLCSAVSVLCAFSTPLAFGQAGRAADYPKAPVTIVVASQPGSAPDQIARIIGPHLSAMLGQPFVIENRSGAGSTIGARAVADAKPDGQTLLLGTVASNASSPQVIKVNYDPIRSFEPVSSVASVPFVAVVNPSLNVRTLKDFIALAKSKPGQLNYSTPGRGGPQHLLTEMFSAQTGIKMEHVPYKSGSAAVMAVLAGETAIYISGMPPALPQIKAGKLVALAVTTPQRSPFAPDIPTLAELGEQGLDAENWHVLYSPAKTPAPIVAKLARAMKTIVSTPAVLEQLADVGAEPRFLDGLPLRAFLEAEVQRWSKAAASSGVAP